MKFIEESYARELHGDLTNVFARPLHEVEVALKGSGVHWSCIVVCGGRQCGIHCFDAKGPEYLTSFDQGTETRAMGRTCSKADTIAAVKLWIEGRDLSQLHEQFEFVDRRKRSLSSIRKAAVACCPELNSVGYELKHLLCDIYELWFREKDRSCRISYYGKNPDPDAVFHWDECQNFAIQMGDANQLAPILKRWLCEHRMPSELQKEFPSIELGKIAHYYEKGRGIEGEFIASWDGIEKFYTSMSFPPTEAIKSLINAMRERGYDHTLRAGQSLYTLILSRSRRHGLRDGQPCVGFHFREQGMDVIPGNLGLTRITLPQIVLTDAVEAVLKKLESVAVD